MQSAMPAAMPPAIDAAGTPLAYCSRLVSFQPTRVLQHQPAAQPAIGEAAQPANRVADGTRRWARRSCAIGEGRAVCDTGW
jgi:hypothetical protein